MIITSDNNIKTSIRGFFIYSPSANYEAGDFVVFGNSIYVCSPKGETSVSGEIPNESESFYPYLGDQMIDASEFLTFSEEGGGQSKYVSVSALPAILNNYMAGLTNSGIIGDTITYSETEGFKVSIKEYDSDTLGLFEASTVLSEIMCGNINHGIFKVSRGLPEIKEYVYSEDISEDLDGEYCILKQYTYLDSKKTKIRVQELIDHSCGNIFYRTIPLTDWYPIDQVSKTAFKFATVHTKDLQRKANNLFRVYSARLKGFEARLDELERNFRFSKISVPLGGVSNLNVKDAVSPEEFSEVGPITLTVFTEVQNKLSDSNNKAYESNSLTIDPNYGDIDYYINDDLYISVDVAFEGVDEGSGAVTKALEIRNVSNQYLNLGRGFMSKPEEMDSPLWLYDSEEGNILIVTDTSSSSSKNRISINPQVWLDELEQDSSFVDYSIIRKSDQSVVVGPYTALFRSGGLSESWDKPYDANRNNSTEGTLDYLISYNDFLVNGTDIDVESHYLQFTSPNIFEFKVKNDLGHDLSFPGFGTASSEIISGEEISEDKSFWGFPGRNDRGLYFKSETQFSEAIISISISDAPEKSVKDIYVTSKFINNSYYLGTYEEPIISYKDLAEYLLESDESSYLIITVASKKGGTVLLKNNNSENLIYYLTKPGTHSLITNVRGEFSDGLTGSGIIVDYIKSGNTVSLNLGDYSDFGYDIKILKSLKSNQNNYTIQATTSSGEIITPSEVESELLTIPWEKLEDGETFDVTYEYLEENKYKYYINTDVDLKSVKLKYLFSFRLSYSDEFEEFFNYSLDVTERGISELIYHPGIEPTITIEKYPTDGSEPNTNNYFYCYELTLTSSSGDEILYDSLTMPYYRFIYNEPGTFNRNRGSLRVFQDHGINYDGSIITINEWAGMNDNLSPLWIKLLPGSGLEKSVSFSIESEGKCFTSNNDGKISPITINPGDFDKEIKVYRDTMYSFENFRSRLYVSRKDVYLVIRDSSGKTIFVGNPSTQPGDNNYGQYGEVYYIDSTYLTPDCTIIIDPTEKDLPELGITKKVLIGNESSRMIELVSNIPSTGESISKTLSIGERWSLELEAGQAVNVVPSSDDIYALDVVLNSTSNELFNTTDIYNSEKTSFGENRTALISYSDLSTDSIDLEDNLIISDPSTYDISIKYGDLYASQGFYVYGPLDSRTTVSTTKDGSLTIPLKRPELGFWLDGLMESEISIRFNDSANDDSEDFNDISSGIPISSDTYSFGDSENPVIKFGDIIGYINEGDPYNFTINSKKFSISIENNTTTSLVLKYDGGQKEINSGITFIENSLSIGSPQPIYFEQSKKGVFQQFDVSVKNSLGEELYTSTIFFNDDNTSSQGYVDGSVNYFTTPESLGDGYSLVVNKVVYKEITINPIGFSGQTSDYEYICSGFSDVNFNRGEEFKLEEEFLYPNGGQRGLSFKLTTNRIKVRLYKSLDTAIYKELSFSGVESSGNYYIYGSLDKPVITYSELNSYEKIEIINSPIQQSTTTVMPPTSTESPSSTFSIRRRSSMVEMDSSSEDDSLATFSIDYSSVNNGYGIMLAEDTPSTGSTTTTTGTIITKLNISLKGSKSPNSKIISAYYRKYFKNK